MSSGLETGARSLTLRVGAGLCAAIGALLAGCVNVSGPAQLDEEQACLHHHENNPVEQARCRLEPDLRDGTPPDMMPEELPVRTRRVNE